MKNRAQCGITAGIAIVGASVITLTPIAPPPTETFPSAEAVAVNLTASPIEILAGGLGESALNLAKGTVGIPLGLIPIAEALADRDNTALYLAIREYIDSPLWIADPTIFALDNVLPSPIGDDPDENPETADGSQITAFRADVLWAATYAARAPFAAALGVEDDGDPLANAEVNIPVTLAVGLAGSAVRLAESVALAPLGPVKIAVDVAGGKEFNQALYEAARNYIDAPLYIADPTIFALDNVLPQPIGGDPDEDPETAHGSAITQFRADVLWKATSDIRTPIRDALGAEDPQSGASARVGTFSENDGDAAVKELKVPAKEKSITGQDKFDAKSLLGSNKKTVGAHRKQTDGPIRAAVKQLRNSVKAASTPK